MATRPVNQTFEAFRGVDRRKSPLTTDRLFARQADNAVLIDEQLTIREGSKPVCSVGGSDYWPLKVFTHSYYDEDTGASKEYLCVLIVDRTEQVPGVMAFDAITDTFDITYSGAGTATFSFIPLEGDEWQADLQVNGTSVSGWPKKYGTGYSIVAGDYIESLQSDIDGETDWSASLPTNLQSATFSQNYPCAICPIYEDEAVSTTLNIPLYNIVELRGDNSGVSPNTSVALLEDVALTGNQFSPGYIPPTVVNKRNVTYIGMNGYWLLKFDGWKLCRAGLPNAVGWLESATTVNSGGSLSEGSYQWFFDCIVADNRGNIIQSSPSAIQQVDVPASSRYVDLYAYSPGIRLDLGEVVPSGTGSVKEVTISENLSVRQQLPRVGDYLSVSQSRWKRARITGIDRTGEDTVEYTFASSFTASAGDDVAIREENLGDVYAQVNGAQSSVSTITVYADGVSGFTHNIVAGDKVYIGRGLVGSSSPLELYNVTAVTSTTITIDGVVTLSGDERISNVKFRLWRTTVGGEIFYLSKETPVLAGLLEIISDGVADSTLEQREVWEEPLKTPAPPRRCSVVTDHQTLLVTAGDYSNPNTFSFEDIEIAESFPARNAVDLPSTIRGAITALGSENNILSVCKRVSHFPVLGDLDAGDFQYGKITEGDLGIPSHNSLALVEGVLVGLSEKGPVVIQEGVIRKAIGQPLRPDFRGQIYSQQAGTAITSAQESKLVFERAQGVNDYLSEEYILYVPTEEGTPQSGRLPDTGITSKRYPSSNGKYYVLDYSEIEQGVFRWFDRTYPLKHNAYGGFTVYNNQLHWLPVWYDSGISTDYAINVMRAPDSNSSYDYVDNLTAITWDVWLQHEGVKTPSQLKEFQALKFYMFNLGTFYSFDLRVRIYRNFEDSSPQTDVTLSYSSSDDIEKALNAVIDYARVAQIRLTVTGFRDRPLITGYEFQAAIEGDSELVGEII